MYACVCVWKRVKSVYVSWKNLEKEYLAYLVCAWSIYDICDDAKARIVNICIWKIDSEKKEIKLKFARAQERIDEIKEEKKKKKKQTKWAAEEFEAKISKESENETER